MLILVRHGRTVANASRLLQGRSDHPLDDLGRAQAEAQAGVMGRVDRVVSSPLARAVQTAEAVAARSPGVDIEIDPRFVELDYGEWEGRPVADVPPEIWTRWRTDPTFAPPGGETLTALDERVRQACEELLAEAEATTVAVCSHVSPIKSVVAWALGVSLDVTWRMHVDNGSRSVVAVRQGRPLLAGFNITEEVR